MTKRKSIEQVLQLQLPAIQLGLCSVICFNRTALFSVITRGYSFPVTMYVHASYAHTFVCEYM